MYQEEQEVSQGGPEFVNQAMNYAQEALGSAEEVASKNLKRAVDLIKKHPVESVAIGFGVGCLIGALLSRKH